MMSDEDHPPPGFVALPNATPFEVFAGPFYVRDETGGATVAFRCKARHLNGAGICQGGVLSTFADMQGYGLAEVPRTSGSVPTVTLATDFLAPVRAGDWVEGQPVVLRVTRSLLFFHSVLRVGARPVGRCDGIFRILAPRAPQVPQVQAPA